LKTKKMRVVMTKPKRHGKTAGAAKRDGSDGLKFAQGGDQGNRKSRGGTRESMGGRRCQPNPTTGERKKKKANGRRKRFTE